MGKKRITVLIILIALLSLSFQPPLVVGETYSGTLPSIAFSGTLTLTTTATQTQEFAGLSLEQKRTCTFTIPFTINVTSLLAEVLPNEEGDDLFGGSLETGSFSGDWSFTVFEDAGSPASLSVGQVSGSVDVSVIAEVKNDQVFFGFLPLGWPENVSPGGIPVEFTITDREFDPPLVYTSVWLVTHPYTDGMFALLDASGGYLFWNDGSPQDLTDCDVIVNTKIKSSEWRLVTGGERLQEITFSGEIPERGIEYTGSVEFDFYYLGSLVCTEPPALDMGVDMQVRTREKIGGYSEWRPLEVGDSLGLGDQIETKRVDRAVIVYPDGSKIALGPGSKFEFDETDASLWNLIEGKLRIFLIEHVGVKVRTYTSSSGVRGTEFTVEVDENNATTVTVFDGVVEVQDLTSGSSVLLEANQMLNVPKTPMGLTEQELEQQIVTVDPESVDRWWEESSITCSVSVGTITPDESITVSGSLDPRLEGVTITLTYKNPDGSAFNRTVTTGPDGFYSDTYEPDATGTWKVAASWVGDENYKGADSSARARSVAVNDLSGTFTVTTPSTQETETTEEEETQGGGGIPGFPFETIVLGLLMGILIILKMREKVIPNIARV